MPSATELQSWHERDVLDSNGERVGKLDGIYTSDATGDAAFALVREGILGNHLHFVPTTGARDGRRGRAGRASTRRRCWPLPRSRSTST